MVLRSRSVRHQWPGECTYMVTRPAAVAIRKYLSLFKQGPVLLFLLLSKIHRSSQDYFWPAGLKENLSLSLCTRLSWGSFWWKIWICRGSHKNAHERTTNYLRSSSKGLLRKQANSVSCWAGYSNQPAGPTALRFSAYTPPMIFTNVPL